MVRTKSDIQTELDEVRTAIRNIVNGEVSSVEMNDRSLQHLDLDQLRKREKDLIDELNRAKGIKKHSVATFPK